MDQHGAPFLIVGDSPQSLIANLSEADAATYFAARQAQGFNVLWINLLCDTYTGCRSDGSTYDGILPFTTPGDLSTPNPAYFQRATAMIALAAQYGFTVFLDPIETGGWLSTLKNNGQSADYAYGQYVGTLFAQYTNIVWISGNDFQSWMYSPDNPDVLAVAQGIQNTDPTALQTNELSYPDSDSLEDTSWDSVLNLDGVYTYSPTYEWMLMAYNRNALPVFLEETNYEGENNLGTDPSTPVLLRKEAYWTYLSGAAGYLFGNHYIWPFSSGWQQNLSGQQLAGQPIIGAPGATQLGYAAALLTSHAWYNLVPDQQHTFLTAGYGTEGSGTITANNYATAALTADGTLGMIYTPAATTLSVNLGAMAGPVTAQWFDPTNGTYQTISGSPFANSGSQQFTTPGTNNGGDPDWVLVLQAGVTGTPTPTQAIPAASPTPTLTAPSNTSTPTLAAPSSTPTSTPVAPSSTSTPTPAAPSSTPTSTLAGPSSTPTPMAPSFVQVTATTPQSPQTSVAVAYPHAQAAGDTNLLVIGWNDTTATINSVTDSAGNTYQVAAATARGNGVSQAIYYATNIVAAGAGANTVAVTFSQPAAFVDVRILEYSGLAQTHPLDVSASASGMSASASSGSATTSAASELIVGAGTTSGAFSGAGPGFISRIITTPDSDISGDQSVTASGLYSATAPLTGSGAWVMQMVSFKAAT